MAMPHQDVSSTLLEAIPSDTTQVPGRPTVLVFDSGVGGLSVYDEVRQMLPDLHYIYAFDNVAFPYGEKSEEFIVERVVEIVTAVAKRHPLSIIVIACNTASTVSLPALRAKFSCPVVGVVPAIKPASAQRWTKTLASTLLTVCPVGRASSSPPSAAVRVTSPSLDETTPNRILPLAWVR